MSLNELLEALGATTATDVTLSTIPNAGGADAASNTKAADQRVEAMSRGECAATCGAKSRLVSASEASALIAAGATDAR